MTPSIIAFAALLVCDQTPSAGSPPSRERGGTKEERKSHPLAPSLPLLSKEEYEGFERVIERFVQYDTGKLKGEEGKKALADFKRLGSEAVFQLLEGFNRAANMEDSCPAVLIARKLGMIINSTTDVELLSFLKENIGLEVTAKRHMNVVKDLRVSAQLRRSAVQRQIAAAGGGKKGPATKPARSMTLAELTAAAAKERGQPLRNALSEIERRDGPEALDILASAAADAEAEVREFAQKLLAVNLARQKPDKLKAPLKHERAEVRAAAAQAIASKRLRWGDELIGLLDDTDGKVRQAARQALVQMSGGADYGPAPEASADDRAEAVRRWRQWWSQEKKK